MAGLARLSAKLGGGSLTALPIADTLDELTQRHRQVRQDEITVDIVE
jgi:hypothetical protein